jgi:hypothetical protein
MGFNPYFDLRVLSHAHDRATKVVIHTAEPLVLTQDPKISATQRIHQVRKDCDLEVHADELTLVGPIEALGCNITLFARVIKCCMKLTGVPQNSAQAMLARAKQLLPRITVDGMPGPPPENQLDKYAKSTKPEYNLHKLLPVPAAWGHSTFSSVCEGSASKIVWGAHDRDWCTPGAPGDGRQSVECDGRMDGAHGDPGACGNHAGSIILKADWLVRVDNPDEKIFASPDPAGGSFVPMLLYARGGRGGDGQAGQDGADGDHGGHGADGDRRIPRRPKNDWAHESGLGDVNDPTFFTPATDGGPGGNAGNGGAGGAAGPGGAGGAIFVSIGWGNAQPPNPQNLVAADNLPYTVCAADPLGDWFYVFFLCYDGGPIGKGGAPGAAGTPGLGGERGKGFPADKVGYGDFPHPQVDHFFAWAKEQHTNDGAGGQEGKAGEKGLEDSNKVGKVGTVRCTTKASAPEIASLCHVEQLQMVFDRVGCQYLSIDLTQPNPQDWKLIGATLGWLKRMLSNYPTERPGNVPVPVPPSEAQWVKHLADEVTALQVRHNNGYDYFGKSANYAPVLSLDTYDSALTSSLKTLFRLESKRNKLKTFLDEDEKLAIKFADAEDEAGRALAHLRDKLRNVHQARVEMRKKIDGQGASAGNCRQHLLATMHDLSAEVQSSFGMDAESVINALSQVAFMGAPLAPKEGGGPLTDTP